MKKPEPAIRPVPAGLFGGTAAQGRKDPWIFRLSDDESR